MDGRPVWLASASWRDSRGQIVATGNWSKSRRLLIEEVLREQVLAGVGDESAERVFRMNVTLCIHRALTEEEEAGLGPAFCDAEAIHIAGGPIEILSETVPNRPSTQPCENPEHKVIDPLRLDLWFPYDCGECEPCRARAKIASYDPTVAA